MIKLDIKKKFKLTRSTLAVIDTSLDILPEKIRKERLVDPGFLIHYAVRIQGFCVDVIYFCPVQELIVCVQYMLDRD